MKLTNETASIAKPETDINFSKSQSLKTDLEKPALSRATSTQSSTAAWNSQT